MALDVDAATVRGRWVRHTPPDADPVGYGRPPDDNRWQRGHRADALYLADSEPCAWAEWYRHLAERGFPPSAGLPRDLWHYTVGDLEAADVSTLERLSRLGLSLPRPGRRSWPAFQAVGEQLHADGWSAILAPSAARPANLVLCLFLPHAADTLRPQARVRVSTAPPIPTGMRT